MTDQVALAATLRHVFTETELHAFIVTAELPLNRDLPHWQKLRKAAIEAADCDGCNHR